MAAKTPTVQAGTLILSSPSGGERHEIVAGSDAWFSWLESARTFIFSDPSGHFSARKRRRWDTDYWYAVLRRGGKLREAYLGKARDITLERLHSVALQLNQLTAPTPGERPTAPSGVSAAAPALSDPDSSATRLSAPRLQPASLLKTQALARLTRATRHRVTIVSAPVGYGKTTLIAHWLARSGARAAWLSLTARENDPARFWMRLASALLRAAPHLLESVRATRDALSAAASADDWCELVTSTLSGARSPVVVVLDDYAVIQPDNMAIHTAVGRLAEQLSPHVRLIIASQTMPPVPLADLDALDHVSVLRSGDLQLTRAETGALLRLLSQLNLTDDDIAQLHARTEGWMAGVLLAARALSEHPHLREHIAEFDGENDVVFEYLAENVLRPLPTADRAFLLRCAVLERMTGALCDAVTRLGNGQAMLDALDVEQRFLVPLDERGEWYRFHRLFAGTLRRALRMTDSDMEPELCARASIWHAAHGLPLEAVDYALAANDLAGAARLLDTYAPLVLVRQYPEALLDRLDHLPDRYIRERPRLCVGHAYSLLIRGERALLPHRVAEAERALTDATLPLESSTLPLVRTEVSALRAIVSHLHGEVRSRELIESCQRALAKLPDAHAFRPFLALTMGTQQFLEGDVRSASRTLETLMRVSETLGDGLSVSLALLYLGMATLLQGRLDDALALGRRAMRVPAPPSHALTARSNALRGAVWYERNYLERALTDSRRALDAPGDPVSRLLQAYPVLAYTYLALGDAVSADHAMQRCLREWETVAGEQRLVWTWSGDLLKAHQANLWALRGDVTAASGWARELEVARAAASVKTISAPLFVREWEDIVLARVYLAEHRATDALALLSALRVAAETGRRIVRVVDILVLQAAAHEALGDTEMAIQSLWQALELGAPRRLVRSFLNGGPVVQGLLALVDDAHARRYVRGRRRTTVLLRYAEALLAEFQSHAHADARAGLHRFNHLRAYQNPREPAPRELTAREHQVLRLIVEGASNNDIAQALVVSPATVKRHVSNIFMKLGVHSRTQAVARARDLHLLPDEMSERLLVADATLANTHL